MNPSQIHKGDRIGLYNPVTWYKVIDIEENTFGWRVIVDNGNDKQVLSFFETDRLLVVGVVR